MKSDGTTPISNVLVEAWSSPCQGDWLGSNYTNENGEYAVCGLPEGDVYVKACATCSGLNYIDEWYDNQHAFLQIALCPIAIPFATPVTVTSNANTGNINFQLSVDTDQDLLPDEWEITYFTNLSQPTFGETDNDDLQHLAEYLWGTIPTDPDTDDDGMPDGWEIQYGLNPLVNDADDDADEDDFSNLTEYLRGTIPNDAESHPSRAMPWLPLLLEDQEEVE